MADNKLVKIGKILASKKQASLIKILGIQKKIIIIVGAFRTGKTLFLSYGFAELIILQQKTRLADGNRYAIIGHANKSLTHTNVTSRIVSWLRYRGWRCEVFNGENYRCYNDNIMVILETFAVSDKGDYLQVQGGTYRSMFIDEAPLIKVPDIEEMMGRCQTFSDHKIVMTGNPEGGKAHPFYVKYLKEKSDMYFVMNFTLLDNPIFTREDVEYMRSIFSKSVFERKVMGLWTMTIGAIYSRLPKTMRGGKIVTTENSKILIKADADIQSIAIGVDYGESDATTAVAVGYNRDDDVWYILGEYYHRNSDSTRKLITHYVDDIVTFANSVAQHYDVMVNIYCETSPSTIYSMLSSTGVISRYHKNVIVQKVRKTKDDTKAANAIVERIDATNILIALDKLFIYSEQSHLYDAFSNAEWKSHNIRLDDGKKNVDSLDAFEYALKEDVQYINDYISGFEKGVD